MRQVIAAAAATLLLAGSALAQVAGTGVEGAVPVDFSNDCYVFRPQTGKQSFFLGRDTDVLLQTVGGGGGGGGNTQKSGGAGGAAGEYLFDDSVALKKGLYNVRVGAGGRGGRGKRAPGGEPGDDATAGGQTEVYKLNGGFLRKAAGGAGGKTDGAGDVPGLNGASVTDNGATISEGGAGGARDRNGNSGEAPGAGGGGTGIFVAGGGLIGGSGGGGQVLLCVYERGALASLVGGTRLQQ